MIEEKHPVLSSRDKESVWTYFKKVHEFHKYVRHIYDNLSVSVWVGKIHRFESGTKTALDQCLEPQFAGLLSAYAKRITKAPIRCPLCILNEFTDSGICDSARYYCDGDTGYPCPAASWCNHIHTASSIGQEEKDKARRLVVTECVRRNIPILEWLPTWS